MNTRRRKSHATDIAQTLRARTLFFNSKQCWGIAEISVKGKFEEIYIHGRGCVGSAKRIYRNTIICIDADAIVQDMTTVHGDDRPRRRKAVSWYPLCNKQSSSYGGTRPRSKKPTSSVSSSRPQHKQRSAKK